MCLPRTYKTYRTPNVWFLDMPVGNSGINQETCNFGGLEQYTKNLEIENLLLCTVRTYKLK